MPECNTSMPDRRNIKTNKIEKRAHMSLAQKKQNGVFSQEVMMNLNATAPAKYASKRGSIEGSIDGQGEWSVSNQPESCVEHASLMARQRDLDQMKRNLRATTEEKMCAIDVGLHGNTDMERHNQELYAHEQACRAEIGHQEYVNKMNLVRGRNRLMPNSQSTKVTARSTVSRPFHATRASMATTAGTEPFYIYQTQKKSLQ